jgi:uncharacterized protein YndB with AHSA1/START domain
VILVSESATLEPIVIDAIERYFDFLQAHASATEMIENVLTDDFETGFADGFRWRGADGLAEFLDARSMFFDESHDVLQLTNVTRADEHSIQAQTRLRFFLRRHQQGAATSEEFTGQVWHTWRLRREPSEGRWRIAAQIVDGFAQLNDNAATLFGAPAEGLRT